MIKIKILPLILLTSIGFITGSCYYGDGSIATYQNIPHKEVIISGNFTEANDWTIFQNMNIPYDYKVEVYRNDTNTYYTTSWQEIPLTYYLSNGRELDYKFSINDHGISIYIDGNVNPNTLSYVEANTYLNNQTFRIVVIPPAYAAH
ncbi:hypothetical protein [Chryseobacterium sp.]|uniref:hypothetical protein n=1 Tax=Chryseobacterium sp. TaxID=1871047 RepID=UPI0025BCFFCF|nr:hypothetical protein [Chryseobacterium sp.]MBV8325157.1 hypothetical protein [Chryseobacterium sp.]